MFSKYEIRNVSGEDVLYLYLNQHYEFSQEFDQDLNLYSSQFIQMNQIPFQGNKIYYVVDGIVVKKADYHHPYYYDPDHFLIHLQLEDQSMVEIPLRDYLTSILFSYYSPELGSETLKCICILFNTYAYKKMEEDGFILADNSFAYYISYQEYQSKYPNYSDILNQLSSIIQSVSCIFIAYQKHYILPFIHYCNGGKTYSNIKYPYLSSVSSLWDLSSPTYLNIQDYSYSSLSDLLKIPIDSTAKIQIQNDGHSIKFRYKTYTIKELKEILHLKSNDISMIVNRDGIRFITKGVGNALGLSIFGASCIEQNGGDAYTILNYYFPKCAIYKNIKELS